MIQRQNIKSGNVWLLNGDSKSQKKLPDVLKNLRDASPDYYTQENFQAPWLEKIRHSFHGHLEI